ncbi:MAG: hypothetical protein IT372_23355 [Polyangiaceae bacterium]|nr:hypothetical protein [Polyangiaceae bacterium]
MTQHDSSPPSPVATLLVNGGMARPPSYCWTDWPRVDVSALAWSPCGGRLAIAVNRTVRIWDVADRRPLCAVHPPALDALPGNDHGRVTALAWHPAGQWLASAADEMIRIWDIKTGRERVRFAGGAAALAWDARGYRLAIVGGSKDGIEIRIWEQESSHPPLPVSRLLCGPVSLAWDRTGDLVSVAPAGRLQSDHGRVVIALDGPLAWTQVATGQELSRLRPAARFDAIAWTPCGGRVALIDHHGKGAIQAVHGASGDALCYFRFRTNHTILPMASWDPEGRRLAVPSLNDVLILDGSTGAEISRIEQERIPAMIAWDIHGRRLASLDDQEDRVRIWDITTGAVATRIDDVCGPMAWDAERRRVAGRDSGYRLCIWDGDTGQQLARTDGPCSIQPFAWEDDGKRLLVDRHATRGWEKISESPAEIVPVPSGDFVTNAWEPRRRRLVSAYLGDSAWFIRDAATGAELLRLDEPVDWIDFVREFQVAWDSLGDRLAVATGDGCVRIRTAVSGEELVCIEDAAGPLAWDPAGDRLAGAGGDGWVRIWDAASGRELGRLESRGVAALAWRPDGRWLAGAVHDGIRLWDATGLRLLATLESVGPFSLVRTPSGFCDLRQAGANRVHLASRQGEPLRRTVYAPLADLREVLCRPDKVKAALAGDLSGDDLPWPVQGR